MKNNNNIGQELSEFKPVEIVGYEVCEAGSPNALSSMVVHRRIEMNNKSLMERLLEAGYPPEDIDHYYYDLYVYVTPLTTKVIMEWADENGYDSNLRDGVFVQTFKDQITGRKMYDIAFQYIPSLDKKVES